MATPKKIRVILDERTDKLTDGMLNCRAFRHDFRKLPPNPDRFAELLRQGYKEVVERCAAGCGTTWTRVFSRASGAMVEQYRTYDPDYKMPRGTGRMSKDEARKAQFAREDKELYAVR